MSLKLQANRKQNLYTFHARVIVIVFDKHTCIERSVFQRKLSGFDLHLQREADLCLLIYSSWKCQCKTTELLVGSKDHLHALTPL